MAAEKVKDARLVRYVRNHPDATARQVAERFYTAKSQLVVGSRLSRLVNAGLLTKRFQDGWKYSASEVPTNG